MVLPVVTAEPPPAVSVQEKLDEAAKEAFTLEVPEAPKLPVTDT